MHAGPAGDALWLLGYPRTALAELDRALNAAHETGHAGTRMFALDNATLTHICCRDHAIANAHLDERIALAEEKGAVLWKMLATIERGCVSALTGKASDAVQTISAGMPGIGQRGNSMDYLVVITFGFGLCGPQKIR